MWFSGGLSSTALIIALNHHKGLLQPKCFSDSIILQVNPLWALQLGPAVQVKLEEKFLIAYSAPGCWLEISAGSSSWVCLQSCACSWHWKSSTRHIYPLICNKWLDMPRKGQAHPTWPQTPLFPHLWWWLFVSTQQICPFALPHTNILTFNVLQWQWYKVIILGGQNLQLSMGKAPASQASFSNDLNWTIWKFSPSTCCSPSRN